MRDCPGGQRGPGELVGLQGQTLQSTRTVPSNMQKEKQARQKAGTEQSISD